MRDTRLENGEEEWTLEEYLSGNKKLVRRSGGRTIYLGNNPRTNREESSIFEALKPFGLARA